MSFAEDEAADWLRSSRDDRLRRWQPRHMRDRSNGRFRGSDYALHCDLGGNPTREGPRLLYVIGNRLVRQNTVKYTGGEPDSGPNS